MKTLSYSDVVNLARKIENKGRDKHAASDLHKKAKTGGSFSGSFSENQRAGNQGQHRVLRQGHICLHSPHIGHIIDRVLGDRQHLNIVILGRYMPLLQSARPVMLQGVQASNAVVTYILSVCSFDALALIDPRSTHSYVSSYFSLRFSKQPELLNDHFLVATPVGESLLAEYVCRACLIRVKGRDTLGDLIVLDKIDVDMLMGMDWLSSCYAIVDCHAKIVKFEIPNEPSFVL
uniref:Uncharacterized protein LOC104245843 n=1 Tax=Nicotiana sylvestris TaxID=4096 RepID=A0A1U7YD04_NICSY|nr:PREDICTED: uncharacterized protein LOC104245843 [Nicotiana sylvestris]